MQKPNEALKEALKGLDAEALKRVAQAAQTEVDYLKDQLANGHRKPGVPLAKRLVRALAFEGRYVSLEELRPDIYAEETPPGRGEAAAA